MSKHTKPNITHVRTAEADALAVKELYLINRGWQKVEQPGAVLWYSDHNSSASPIELDQAIRLQDRLDQQEKVNKAAKMEDADDKA